MTPKELATRWRVDADLLERYDSPLAAVCRRHADELDGALRSEADEALDLATAAAESGYSTRHLRHLVAAGTLANLGRKHAPRVRRGDLTKIRQKAGVAFDAASVAADVLRIRGVR